MAKAAFYKVFTHDLRSPIQGGNPVWNGTLPYKLPLVALDTSQEECGAGWNCSRSLADALAIAGLWPNGHPSVAYIVDPATDVIHRSNKSRASSLTVVERCSEEAIADAIQELSQRWFKEHANAMSVEQIRWRYALQRPKYDEAAVIAALAECWPKWSPKAYKAARDARNAWNAWNARNARNAWNAWNVRDAWTALDALAARDAWAARNVWDDAWAAWAARDAWAACSERYSILCGWVDPIINRNAIATAYEHGANIVVPTDQGELGYVMMEVA